MDNKQTNMNAVEAGRLAKAQGHEYERDLTDTMNEMFGGDHVTDGRPQTKVDIYDNESTTAYSVKNVSKNHTQVALLSSRKFIEYFGLEDTLPALFIRLFFGVPNNFGMSTVKLRHKDLPLCDAEERQNRVYANNIPQPVKDAFLDFMNANKMRIFDVIVRRGLDNGMPVSKMVWRNKKTDDMKIINIDDLSKQCDGGEWKLNRTTLEFRTADGFKLFHLQMKGSGKKYNSGYHGMMFHIYQ